MDSFELGVPFVQLKGDAAAFVQNRKRNNSNSSSNGSDNNNGLDDQKVLGVAGFAAKKKTI